MKTYSIKVETQNLSKSFVYYEADNLNYETANNKLKTHQKKYIDFISKGIEPVVYDNRNRPVKVTKMYLIQNKEVQQWSFLT